MFDIEDTDRQQCADSSRHHPVVSCSAAFRF